MPRIFSEEEIKLIQENLMLKGKELFGIHGLKKTSISDLTNAVGIAQGSFYKFFDSKESLFMAILEKEENFRDEYMNNLIKEDLSFYELIRNLFATTFQHVDDNPIFQRLYKDNTYEVLMRKLPEKQMEAHRKQDEEAMLPLLKELKAKGLSPDVDLETLTGLFRALFLLTLHKKEIGYEIYPKVNTLLIEVIARGLSHTERSTK